MRFARAVATDPTRITKSDIDDLRREGFDDRAIFDIAAAASARSFFSKMLEALGAEPDAVFWDLDADLRDALTVGRPIEPVDL
jgi:alkylhydroperoxidase family enzyme